MNAARTIAQTIRTTLAAAHHMGYRKATIKAGGDVFKVLIHADDTVVVTFATIGGVGHQDRRCTTTDTTRPVLLCGVADLAAKTGRSLSLAA